jgi:hypothetical protein
VICGVSQALLAAGNNPALLLARGSRPLIQQLGAAAGMKESGENLTSRAADLALRKNAA